MNARWHEPTIDWDCPQCGTTNTDLTHQGTHCGSCGRVVWVLDEDGNFFDEKWNVEMPPPPPAASDEREA